MMKRLDFRALSIGALIYFVGSNLLIAIIAFILVDVDNDNFVITYEFLIELLVSIIMIFLAGYYTQEQTRVEILNQSLILGIIFFVYHLLGTLSQMGDSNGDPFLWNISFDISIIIFAFLGSKFSIWRTKRKR